MKNAFLGTLEVSRIGLDAMTYTSGGGLDDAESIRTIHRALDLGLTFLDTAEIYGPYTNEELVGRAIAGRRDHVVLGSEPAYTRTRNEPQVNRLIEPRAARRIGVLPPLAIAAVLPTLLPHDSPH